MCSKKLLSFLFIAIVLVQNTVGLLWLTPSTETGLEAVRKAPRWNLPWLWIGMYCNGCPPRGCEDDEAIIHGYCCGCAYHFDRLPITCPEFLQCPLNMHGLCHDYEYMMRCCC